jgi:DNA-binding transcriptional regulator GbsR (MarR family)
LHEIAAELGVSKASVSTAVRQLERWSAIKRVWVKGDRRDFYEAETDFNTVIRNGLLVTLRKKFETAGKHMEVIENSLKKVKVSNVSRRNDIEIIEERLQRAREFHGKLNSLLASPLADHLL